MTTASVTAYSSVSTLPKDAAGTPFGGLVRSDASVTPITLYKGIGASPGETDLLFSHLAIGSHTGASPVGEFDPGTLLAGVYIGDGNAGGSALTPDIDHGKAQLIRSTRFGELAVAGIAKTPSLLTTSQNSLASGVVYGLNVAVLDANPGDTIELENFGNTVFSHVVQSASESKYYDFGNGGMWFGTSIVVVRNVGGAQTASMTLLLAV
jgi:hypothetical protein